MAISAGASPHGSTPTGWVPVAAAALASVVLAAVLVVADLWWRARELDRLLAAVETSQEVIRHGDMSVDAEVERLTSPGGGPLPPSLPDEVLQGVTAAAGRAAASTRVAGAEVEQVSVLPWHGAIKEAQQAYLEHNKAWVTYLRASASDPAQLTAESLRSDIVGTYLIAADRAAAAVPRWTGSELNRSVDALFAAP